MYCSQECAAHGELVLLVCVWELPGHVPACVCPLANICSTHGQHFLPDFCSCPVQGKDSTNKSKPATVLLREPGNRHGCWAVVLMWNVPVPGEVSVPHSTLSAGCRISWQGAVFLAFEVSNSTQSIFPLIEQITLKP